MITYKDPFDDNDEIILDAFDDSDDYDAFDDNDNGGMIHSYNTSNAVQGEPGAVEPAREVYRRP